MFSWGTSGGEREAFDGLLEIHGQRVPSAEVTNAAVAFADKAREQLAIRLSTGNPPDLFQANMGADLFTWVETNGLDDGASVVEGLNDLADALDWYDSFDRDVLESLTYNGQLYGVPVNVLQQASIKAFSTSKKVRALSGILVGSARDSLHPELSASLREESTDIIERFLRANYPFD